MSQLTDRQIQRRWRTLLTAVLLSMWAPLATGVAVLLSRSTTQVADFVRRTVELVALLIALFTFRYVHSTIGLAPAQRLRLERLAASFTAAALVVSGLVVGALAASRIRGFEPGGNAVPGLVIAILGAFTNSWFWRRYRVLTNESGDAIMESQLRLYRAKTLVDLVVVVSLAMVVAVPQHVVTPYVDLLGSLAVALYLVWSGVGGVGKHQVVAERPLSRTGAG